MRTIRLIYLLSGILLSAATNAQTPEQFREIGVSSFKSAITGIEWNEYTEFLHNDSGPCKQELLDKFRLLPATPVEEKHYDELLSGFKELLPQISEFLEEYSDDLDGLHNVEGDQVPREYWSDWFFRKLRSSKNANEFVENYLTRYDGYNIYLPEEGKNELKAIWEIYKKNIWGVKLEMTYDPEEFQGCTLERALQMEPFTISATRIIWTVRLIAYIRCGCGPGSRSEDLDKANVHLETFVPMRIGNLDINRAQFWGPQGKDVRPRLSIRMIECCGNPKDSEGYTDPVPEGEGEDGDDKSGGYYNPVDQEKENCCDNEQANNSIGAFPIIQLGNNFEDSTIGVGVEYLHNMGTSFGNNNWFVGGAAMYATSSGADGELKENFYAGAAIVENRTPIVPCFQWVQRVCAQYGEGTLDAFGSEDEFRQFTFGIHTGINIDVSDSVSLFGDATVLELGSQTYTAENGFETKTDIGNLGLGRQRIQFGIRFKFQ